MFLRVFLDPELSEGWNVCFTVNLDVSKTAFLALELKPNIFGLTRARTVFKMRVSKALFSFQKRELPNENYLFHYYFFILRKCHGHAFFFF